MFAVFDPLKTPSRTTWIDHTKIVAIRRVPVPGEDDASMIYVEGGHSFEVNMTPQDLINKIDEYNRMEGGKS